MAPKGTKPQKKAEKQLEKAVKKVVKTEVRKTKPKMVHSGLSRAVVRDTQKQTQKRVQRLEKKLKQQNKKINGPVPQDSMQVTATLGVITGNGENSVDGLVRKMKYFMNPLLLKLDSNGQQITPLAERAAMYQMWKLKYLNFKFQPLVNSSNVSGSLVIIDYDQQGTTAKPEGLDTIKARRHREMPIGKFGSFKLPARNLLGPKTGWWLMDTNEDADQAFGGAVNIWVYLRTKNLLGVTENQTTDYKGPLFLLEVQAKYDFTGYSPKPALALLQTENAETRTNDATLSNDADGHVILTLNEPGVDANCKTLHSVLQTAAHDEHDNQTFWAISSEVVALVSSALGSWGWLLQGGWFIVKKLAGVSYNGTSRFLLYASVEDAQRNAPIKTTVTRSNVQIPAGEWRVQQLTTPNVNTYTQPTSLRTTGLPSRPLQLDAQPVLDVLLQQNGRTWEKWPSSQIQSKRFGILIPGPCEYKVYAPSASHDVQFKFETDGGHGQNYTQALQTTNNRKMVLLRPYGPVTVVGSQENINASVFSTSYDWNETDLSESTIMIEQKYQPASGKVFQLQTKATSSQDWIEWQTPNRKLISTIDAQDGDHIFLMKLHFTDATITKDDTTKFFPAFLLYNKTNGKIVIGLWWSPPDDEKKYKPLPFVFQITGTTSGAGRLWDINFPLGYRELPDEEEDDEDDVMSSVSAMYQKLDLEEVENEKEYWRRTAQALMAEKVSRMNHFPQSSSGL